MFASTANGLVGAFMLLWAITLMAATICLSLWAIAVWHVFHFKDVPNRFAWIVIILGVPFLGAAVYYLFALLPYNRHLANTVK